MDQITEIPLEQLHESPFNPRKTFLALDELAASIKSEGRIHQPLLVRPRLANILRPETADNIDGYEIVFGHRRYRAAEVAQTLAAARARPRSRVDLELIVEALAEEFSPSLVLAAEARGFEDEQDFLDQLPKLSADDLGLLAIELVLRNDTAVDPWNPKRTGETLAIAAEHYDVDLEATRAEALGIPAPVASTPSTAARAQKPARAAGAKPKRGSAAQQPAAAAAEEQMDDAGSAGERDPNTSDMFEAA